MKSLFALALLSFAVTLFVVSQSFGLENCNARTAKPEFTKCTSDFQLCATPCQVFETCNDINLIFTTITADKRKRRTNEEEKSRACVATANESFCEIKSENCYQMTSCFLDRMLFPPACNWGKVSCGAASMADYADSTTNCDPPRGH